MPRILTLAFLIFAFTGTATFGQARPDTPRYWIFLRHTDDAAGKRPAPAADDVSPIARERRALRGTRVRPDLDAPLSTSYLDALARMGVRPYRISRWLNALSAPMDAATAARVAALPFVKAIRPVGSLHLHGAPAGTAVPSPIRTAAVEDSVDAGTSRSQLALINALPLLESGINGEGVRLGFLDTSFGQFSHDAFDRLVSEGRLLADTSFAPSQTNSHGQQVASVAVGYTPGRLIGPAWGAEVFGVSTEYAPTETNQEEDDLVAGLEWLERQGVDVVNISLGYTAFDDGQQSYRTDDLDGNTAVTTIAVDLAVGLGVVVVASAGNEGCGAPESCWYYVSTPADADSVIAVGAVTSDTTRASFSSLGPTADGRIKPDVVAPGVSTVIATGDTTFTTGSGTSYASPLVAGVVSQLLQAYPQLTPMEVREALTATASQAAQPDNTLGWGLIDAAAALKYAARFDQPVATDRPVAADGLTRLVAYPNPARTTLRLSIHLAEAARSGRLRVFDVTGRQVVDQSFAGLPQGVHPIDLDVRSLPAGVYVCAFEAGPRTAYGRFVVVP